MKGEGVEEGAQRRPRGGGGHGDGGGALAALGSGEQVGEDQWRVWKLVGGSIRANGGRRKGLRGELEGETVLMAAAAGSGRRSGAYPWALREE